MRKPAPSESVRMMRPRASAASRSRRTSAGSFIDVKPSVVKIGASISWLSVFLSYFPSTTTA